MDLEAIRLMAETRDERCMFGLAIGARCESAATWQLDLKGMVSLGVPLIDAALLNLKFCDEHRGDDAVFVSLPSGSASRMWQRRRA